MALMKTLNSLTKEKDFGEAFIAAMDAAIRAQNAPRKSKPNIKPSKADCLRHMYYILTEAPVDGKETVDPDMTLIQKEGSAMHNIIQDILAKAEAQGIQFYMPAGEVEKAQQMGIRTIVRPSSHDEDTPYEVSCYNEDYDISFKFDGVLKFMGKKVIFELKNEDHFKWMRRVGPEPAHILQATFYSICLGINYVLLVYVGRNYKKRKAYLIEITDEMRATQITRIRIAQWCKKNNIVPSKEECKGCTYCAYKKQCKIDGDQTHEGRINMKEVLGLE
jgi:CRISPR/Cas system-associated exonuclease Cas4 (RecB family)